MEHITKYSLKEKWIVCINIKQDYFEYFHRMCNGNVNDFLEYLYEKFKKRLFYQKVSSYKRTATAHYQPRRKIYKKKIIEIEPSTWKKYWELRLMTGYSISCIIRIFIEWEKLEKGEPVEDLYLLPIKIEDERLEYSYPDNFKKINNYQIKRRWKQRKRMLNYKYWDDS